MESHTFGLDNTPDPKRVAAIKDILAGFENASCIGLRLDTGHRNVEIDEQMTNLITDVYEAGRHGSEYMRGYPIL